MPPKNKSKKANKGQNSRQGRRDGRRPLVTPALAARAAPTTPIPKLIASASQPELKTVTLANGAVRTVKKWCFENSTPVYCSPEEPWPSESLNKGVIIELTGQEMTVSVEDLKISWSEVAYKTPAPQGGMQWVTGWVNDAYLDDYKEEFPNTGVSIPNPTPDPRDAQQYMLWEGKVKYNMCGELCAAFIVDDDIESVLAKWKKSSADSYYEILDAGKDKPTWERHLKDMLAAILPEYGYGSEADQVISLSKVIPSPVDPANLLEHLRAMLPTHYLMSRVTIDGGTGELVRYDPNGTGHWIVIDKIVRNGNRLEVYNPFPNTREHYSLNEFFYSFSPRSGLWVKRKKVRPSSPVETLPKLEVEIANPNPSYKAAQYLDVEGGKKTNLCGEFCVAFILQEPIHAMLERWKLAQPNLYAYHVGTNQPTGTGSLGTILKTYGYNTRGDFVDFGIGLTDPYLKKSLVSPGRIAKMLRTHYFIAGVNIDGGTGRLKPGDDIRHWVVVNKLTPVGKHRGWVELYNPFQNCWEEYSYRELKNSADHLHGILSGMWVKRNIEPVYVEQVVEASPVGDRPGRSHLVRRWTDGQLLEAIKRKSKSGKPLGKIAGELAEASGWKRQEILRRFQTSQVGGARIWTEVKLLAEIRKRLQSNKPKNKIYAELTRLSGWKSRDVKKAYKGLLKAEKWTQAQLLAVLKDKLAKVKSPNKVVRELVDRSGWKRQEILASLKILQEAAKWTEAQLGREIAKRLSVRVNANKIADELAGKSGWKKQNVRVAIRKMIEAKKWSEVELVAALSEKLRAGVPAKKIVVELAPKSGWKTHEVYSLLKKLTEAVKWTETQVHEEVEKLLASGRPVNKIANQVSEMSGWKRWEISKILKTARKVGRKPYEIPKVQPVRVVDPSTIVHASLPREEFVKWQDSLLAQPNTKLRRIQRWGSDTMTKYGMDVVKAGTTNFQAVGLYNNGNKEFGAISNYIRLPYDDVLKLKAMQIEDEYVAKKKHRDWRVQKMNWLCKARGTIYFFYHHASKGDWQTLSYIEWGTLALGGNLVQQEGTEVIHAKMRNGFEGDIEVACLKGFTPADWERPLDELLAEGLVHRCFCAYKDNHFGDSPKGIVYSPFYSPQRWEFVGKTKPTALFIPTEWLEPERSEPPVP